MEPLTLPYGRGLIVSNPSKAGTSRYIGAENQVKYLSKFFDLDLLGLEPKDETVASMQDELLHVMQPTDLLIIIGGDGSLNSVVNGLYRVEAEKRPAALVDAPAGTANDYNRSLNGKLCGEDAMARLLTAGKLVEVRPICLSVEGQQSGSPTERYAVNNAGVGYSADLAQLLNEDPHRNGLLRRVPFVGVSAQEALTAIRSTQDLATFTIHEAGMESELELVDRSLIHARKAAKYGKFAITHLDETFLLIDNADMTRKAVAVAAMKIMLDVPTGTHHTELSFVNGAVAVLAHVDGEVFRLEPGDSVNARLAEKGFNTYSLKAAQGNQALAA